MPQAKRSARLSSSPPRACSGDMYDTVPIVVPSVVACSCAVRVRSASAAAEARFAAEPLEHFRGAGELRRQELERHLPAEPRVLGSVHDAHAALAEAIENPIVSDRGANQEA